MNELERQRLQHIVNVLAKWVASDPSGPGKIKKYTEKDREADRKRLEQIKLKLAS